MSFHRHHKKTKFWREWVRGSQELLAECGLPNTAFQTELDWFLFLDHGYVQSAEERMEGWWTIEALTPAQASKLGRFLEDEYPGEYPQLTEELRRIARKLG